MVEAGYVHIVVDHHDIFRGVGRRAALGGDVRRLYRVPGIALGDRERVQHARAADLMAPDGLDPGNAGIGDILLDRGRTHHRAIARHLIRASAHGRHAKHDRIVAMIDRLDVEYRDLPHAAGVVSGPFAERTFG